MLRVACHQRIELKLSRNTLAGHYCKLEKGRDEYASLGHSYRNITHWGFRIVSYNVLLSNCKIRFEELISDPSNSVVFKFT